MFTVSGLILTHFKNYEISTFRFNENVVAITGDNGAGKTNLLDAIYYLCCTKSYFTSLDIANTSFGQEGFRLEATFQTNGVQENIVCINRVGEKKILTNNEIPYDKLGDHLGTFPVLMIAPDDISMITGSSEIRRKFIDQLLCQLYPGYLFALMKYNKVLLQRNSALKNFADKQQVDAELLDVLDQQLAAPATEVYEYRNKLMSDFPGKANHFYNALSGAAETIEIIYDSILSAQSMKIILHQNRKKDLLAQRTTEGIHRDDLSFTLDGNAFRTTASQGQKKSLLFSLKLAAFEILQRTKDKFPILLLDDVFEKLDEKRLLQLLDIVCKQNSGQVFITDTHPARIKAVLTQLDIPFQSILL